MGPVRQNPIQRTVRTAHLSVLMTVHNFSTQYTQNSSDNLPSRQPSQLRCCLSEEKSGGGKVLCLKNVITTILVSVFIVLKI